MAKRPKLEADRPKANPEITQSAFPELTRCSRCGVLDPGTIATMDFANDPGDGWDWLHPDCVAAFKPTRSVPVRNRSNQVIGAVLEEPDGSCSAYRYSKHGRGLFIGNEPTAQEAANLLLSKRRG